MKFRKINFSAMLDHAFALTYLLAIVELVLKSRYNFGKSIS